MTIQEMRQKGFTKKAFFKWVRDTPNRVYCEKGKCITVCCPIAKFARSQGILPKDGAVAEAGIFPLSQQVCWPFPQWARDVVSAIDASFPDNIKGKDLLPYLREHGVRP